MGLTITATNATAISKGLWSFEMPPHQVRLFAETSHSVGARSIILLKSSSFDPTRGALQFDADDVLSLNIGTTSETIAVAASAGAEGERAPNGTPAQPKGLTYGPGDRQFLQMTQSELPKPMQVAAAALLAGVRQRSSGDLKRGLSRNFSETPDNFWYVIVQPRVAQLSITVRGDLAHFRGMAKLPIKDDRGNTLFKVTSEEDVPAALDIIFHAKRKRP